MSARSTLADLIQAVRSLTFASTAEYTVGTASYWDDVQIATLLDEHRQDLWRVPLQSIQRRAAGGSIQWFDYQAPVGNLEATSGGTAVFYVQDALGTTMGTASWSMDYARGLLSFTQDQRGTTSYFVTARTYDLYATAAQLLRAWGAREKLSYDIAPDNQQLRRSQRFQQMLTMAAEYDRQSWPTSVQMVRSDVLGDQSANGERPYTGYTGGAAHPARG